MKVKVFVIQYTTDGKRRWYRESLSSHVAYALGRELAKLGRRPTVHRIDVPLSKLEQLLRDYDSLR